MKYSWTGFCRCVQMNENPVFHYTLTQDTDKRHFLFFCTDPFHTFKCSLASVLYQAYVSPSNPLVEIHDLPGGREGRVGVSDRPEANQTVIMTRPFITLLLINDNIQKRDRFRNSHKNTRLHQNNASAW